MEIISIIPFLIIARYDNNSNPSFAKFLTTNNSHHKVAMQSFLITDNSVACIIISIVQ